MKKMLILFVILLFLNYILFFIYYVTPLIKAH